MQVFLLHLSPSSTVSNEGTKILMNLRDLKSFKVITVEVLAAVYFNINMVSLQ